MRKKDQKNGMEQMEKRGQKQWKRLCAALLSTGVLCCVASVCVPAAPVVPDDMSQETYDRLQDDVIEWDEIGNLVEYYGPMAELLALSKENITDMMSPMQDSMQNMLNDLEWSERELKDTRAELRAQIEALGNPTDPAGIMQKLILERTLAELEGGMAGMQTSKKLLQDQKANARKGQEAAIKAIDSQTKLQKRSMVNGVQSLFLACKQLEQGMSISRKQVDLYQAAYNAQQASVRTGLATQAQLQAAEYDLLNAQNSLETMQTQFDSLKQTIGLMLGWSSESAGTISFGALPAYDLDYLDGRDLNADIEQAFLTNKTLGTAKRETAHSSSAKQMKETSIAVTEQQIRMEMENMYQTIREKRMAYDAAQTSLQAAAMRRDAAERQRALGLLGNAEYEGLKMQYIAQEAQANMAQMEYLQAVLAYEWAMQGILTIEA